MSVFCGVGAFGLNKLRSVGTFTQVTGTRGSTFAAHSLHGSKGRAAVLSQNEATNHAASRLSSGSH